MTLDDPHQDDDARHAEPAPTRRGFLARAGGFAAGTALLALLAACGGEGDDGDDGEDEEDD